MANGRLFVCPTPIGNLEDITLRVLRVLKEVDCIAAEDTRHTLKLLNHFEIQQTLVSYHEHNKEKRGRELLDKLQEGCAIALVSDAGMPGISDPGQELIQGCIQLGIPVEVLPGATAGILALVASGLDNSRFSFEGFLHRDKKKRRERLEQIAREDRTLVFYEAPHRITDTLEDCIKILGNRRGVLCRELTKRYEEFIRGSLEEILNHFLGQQPKGEMVLLVAGMSTEDRDALIQAEIEAVPVRAHLIRLIEEGMDKKEAVKMVAKERRMSKREVYQESIDL